MPDRRIPALVAIALLWLTACGGHQDDDIDIVQSPCEPIVVSAPGANADQVDSIVRATELWNERGTMLEYVDDATDATLLIEFEDAAPMFKGIYRDELGDIVINSRVTNSGERSIVVAHEVGHVFGMEHVETERSVMSPGNVDVPPLDTDVEELRAIWPDCEF